MSAELQIDLYDQRLHYRPGETVEGVASWQLKKAPTSVKVQLGWFTEGKGTQDSHVQGAVTFDAPEATDARIFQLTLSQEPYSFSGKLISLIWRVELIAGRAREETRIVVSPTGREIELARLTEQAAGDQR